MLKDRDKMKREINKLPSSLRDVMICNNITVTNGQYHIFRSEKKYTFVISLSLQKK